MSRVFKFFPNLVDREEDPRDGDHQQVLQPKLCRSVGGPLNECGEIHSKLLRERKNFDRKCVFMGLGNTGCFN